MGSGARFQQLFALSRDPLMHFLAIGLVLFLAARLLVPQEQDDRRMIINDAVYGELVDIFADTNERAPTLEEMNLLVDRWVLNETLYREAVALGLKDGDEMIRERIMQKMRVLIQNAVIIAPPAEDTLRTWFEARKTDYETPARLSFRIARIDGDGSAAREVAEKLNRSEAKEAAAITIYPFQDRPRPGVVEVFGEKFVAALEQLEAGRWHPMDTVNGWQAVMLDKIAPSEPADFAKNSARIAADYEAEEFRTASTRAVEALIASYKVDVTDTYDPKSFAEVLNQRFGQVVPAPGTPGVVIE